MSGEYTLAVVLLTLVGLWMLLTTWAVDQRFKVLERQVKELQQESIDRQAQAHNEEFAAYQKVPKP